MTATDTTTTTDDPTSTTDAPPTTGSTRRSWSRRLGRTALRTVVVLTVLGLELVLETFHVVDSSATVTTP
jgi:hypothetical protein